MTKDGEYYCGKSKDVTKRLKQHRKEKYPRWFAAKKRKDFGLLYVFSGDYEKEIKRFRIKKFCEALGQL